jgi:hypothetical protein
VKSGLVIGLLAAASMLASQARADEANEGLPDAQAFAAAVLEGRMDLESFDFEAAGYWKADETNRVAWLSGIQPPIFGASATSNTCDPKERRRFIATMWLMLLQRSADAKDWRSNFSALRQGLSAQDAMVREAADKVVAGTDARVTELARRVARDQAIRDMPRLEQMGATMPDAARQLWGAMRLGRMMAIDCENTEWLAAQMREIGWFDIARFGVKADKDAWVLVQHADRSPALQREALERLQKLPSGDTDPKNVAYLGDRVAMGEGKPQRYGTQGKCQPDGTWAPIEIEDAEGVDERRKALGLPPMAEYARRFENLCPKAPVK